MTTKRAKQPPKPTHGGARSGSGRKISTGRGTSKPVGFKVSTEERARGEAQAQAHGLKTIHAFAREAFVAALDTGLPRRPQ